MNSTCLKPETRFSSRVENYVKFRPGYPSSVIAWLREVAEWLPEMVVADVGAGTGISSRLFLEAGCEVFAIEPNTEMREAAMHQLGRHRSFHAIDGTAESTTLDARFVDMIVCGQAFHWFQRQPARDEFTRILKPGGHVVLMWNERELDSTPFLRAYEALLLRYATDYSQVRHENVTHSDLAEFLGHDFRTASFANEQWFDFEGLRGRLLSCSYAPESGQQGHDEMLAELQRIFDECNEGGQVCFRYRTVVHLGC